MPVRQVRRGSLWPAVQRLVVPTLPQAGRQSREPREVENWLGASRSLGRNRRMGCLDQRRLVVEPGSRHERHLDLV